MINIEKNSYKFSEAYQYSAYDNDFLIEFIKLRMEYIRPYIKNRKKILELGCGQGILGEMIKRENQCEIYGTDISKSGIRLARGRGLHAKIADLNKRLPYKSNSFDAIVSDSLLEHIYRTDQLLGEMYRVLKPGGICITITPNLSFWLNRVIFIFGCYPIFLECSEKFKTYGIKPLNIFIKDMHAMGHVRVFNMSALEDMFRYHRFSVLAKKGIPLGWQMPPFLKQTYGFLDRIFSLFPSLSRDIFLVAEKNHEH